MHDLGSASHEIGRILYKIQITPLKAYALKQEIICIFQMVYYLCGGALPSFRLAIPVAASQKTEYNTPKMENMLFMG
jgi:hypothetical protein